MGVRFGYCVNMLSLPGGDESGREFLPLMARLGVDYVELPLAQMMAYDANDFERLFVAPLETFGLACHCCNNFLPAFLRLTGPEADPAAALAYAETAITRARRLGATKIVFGSAGARNYPAGFPREEATAQLAALLRALEPIAVAAGITLVLEHLNKLESNLLNSLHEGVRLMQSVNLPHVRVLLDNYHLTLNGGSLDELREAGGALRHIHLARTLGRGLPCAGDEVDWRALFGMLREIGYNGDCSLEAYAPVEGREERIREALTLVRTMADSNR